MLIYFTVTNLKSIPTLPIQKEIRFEVHIKHCEVRVLEAVPLSVFVISQSGE
jgi:hypothetical protein